MVEVPLKYRYLSNYSATHPRRQHPSTRTYCMYDIMTFITAVTKASWHVTQQLPIKSAIFCRKNLKFQIALLFLNYQYTCVISGFRRDVDEDCALLRYYALFNDLFCTDVLGQPMGPIFKGQEIHWVVVLYRGFGTTYRSHLQGSRSPRLRRLHLSRWTDGLFRNVGTELPQNAA
jgi:hypothetical protein